MRGNTMLLNAHVSAVFTGTTTFTNTASFSSTALFADGTAGAPSIAFTNDATTGMFRVGASTVGLASGGTGIGEWDGSGIYVTAASFFAFLSGAVGTARDVVLSRAWPAGLNTDSDLRFTTANKGLQFKAAGGDTKNRTFGVVTLSNGGSATIYSTAITTTGAIFLSSMSASGFAYISSSTQNVQAVVTSSNSAGTPQVAWMIVNGIA